MKRNNLSQAFVLVILFLLGTVVLFHRPAEAPAGRPPEPAFRSVGAQGSAALAILGLPLERDVDNAARAARADSEAQPAAPRPGSVARRPGSGPLGEERFQALTALLSQPRRGAGPSAFLHGYGLVRE